MVVRMLAVVVTITILMSVIMMVIIYGEDNGDINVYHIVTGKLLWYGHK